MATIGHLNLNRAKSRYVAAAGAVFLVVTGLLPVLGRVVAGIPRPGRRAEAARDGRGFR
ncbi:hypothetical protein GCM10007079_25670 [Nocardiopsis terrae]|uniref:Xanthine/uracil permease n=1 Tax=Nocardiopsis terrae TaxID=372655 RepID=A0ABR9HFM4_9ACTN|nr:solute carrier family 23 protein [Nocardiopsis terrae]MBE1457828.1 xanthine/uracil permease [Nocardiopsis terrae]GHC84060.1 hypothetical protein GCM10007079_25670 [Nocardiopsis terrae]